MNAPKDLSNRKFGRLIAIRIVGRKNRKSMWLCKCECGKETIVSVSHLLSGHTKSCGCIKNENIALVGKTINKRHGFRYTKIYRTWVNMKARCLNPKEQHYPLYGGRGIKVCDRWLNSFENFLIDMGNPPVGTSLDRINVNGDYCPENCRWASNKEQANNKRNTVYLTFRGVVKPLTIWAEEKNINQSTLACRIFKRGWSVEKALTTPVRKRCI